MIHTKFKDFVNESVSNLAKVRTWPTVNGTTDRYFVYDLPKDKIGEYLNTWFTGDRSETTPSRKNHGRRRDEMITLKEVDAESASHLYGRRFNPISIFIMNDYQNREKFQMKAVINSIDDSSYGIWWTNKEYDELDAIRTEIMKYINGLPVVNGEKFLDYCVSLGADEDQRDYN